VCWQASGCLKNGAMRAATILVVADEPFFLEVMSDVLGTAGLRR
jgi:hypothetical protein